MGGGFTIFLKINKWGVWINGGGVAKQNESKFMFPWIFGHQMQLQDPHYYMNLKQNSSTVGQVMYKPFSAKQTFLVTKIKIWARKKMFLSKNMMKIVKFGYFCTLSIHKIELCQDIWNLIINPMLEMNNITIR